MTSTSLVKWLSVLMGMGYSTSAVTGQLGGLYLFSYYTLFCATCTITPLDVVEESAEKIDCTQH